MLCRVKLLRKSTQTMHYSETNGNNNKTKTIDKFISNSVNYRTFSVRFIYAVKPLFLWKTKNQQSSIHDSKHQCHRILLFHTSQSSAFRLKKLTKSRWKIHKVFDRLTSNCLERNTENVSSVQKVLFHKLWFNTFQILKSARKTC